MKASYGPTHALHCNMQLLLLLKDYISHNSQEAGGILISGCRCPRQPRGLLQINLYRKEQPNGLDLILNLISVLDGTKTEIGWIDKLSNLRVLWVFFQHITMQFLGCSWKLLGFGVRIKK